MLIPEADALKAGMEYLQVRRWDVVRTNTGAMAAEHKGRRRFVKFNADGTPDVTGWTPWGFAVGAEAKRSDGRRKLTADQAHYLRRLRAAGGVAFVFGRLEHVELNRRIAELERDARLYLAPVHLDVLADLVAHRAAIEQRFLKRGEEPLGPSTVLATRGR